MSKQEKVSTVLKVLKSKFSNMLNRSKLSTMRGSSDEVKWTKN